MSAENEASGYIKSKLSVGRVNRVVFEAWKNTLLCSGLWYRTLCDLRTTNVPKRFIIVPCENF